MTMAITARERKPNAIASGRPEDWLMLAAAPLFAVMTLVTVLSPAPEAALLCGGEAGFGGMAVMYGLMAIVHLAPWLRLIAGSGRA